MPRILHVFATFGPGGPQVRTADLMHGLGVEFEHAVVSMDGRTDTLELCPDGVRMVDRPQGLGGMRALLKQEAPDLLCTYNWGAYDALLAGRLAGRRAHVHHEDGFNADEVTSRKRRRNWARRLALGKVADVVVPSNLLAGIAQQEWGVRNPRLIVNGVDVTRFTPDGPGRAEVRERFGIPADALVIGAVGHLRPVKRYDVLLRAVAQLEGVHLLLVGDGAEGDRLRALAKECQPASGGIHFAGHQSDLPPFYRAMDLLTISSDSEQLPVTLLEAMACGLPACGTDVGDVRLTVPEGGRDRFVPTGDPAALADVLRALIDDAAAREELGRDSIARAHEVYSLEAMVAAYRAVYLRAAGHSD